MFTTYLKIIMPIKIIILEFIYSCIEVENNLLRAFFYKYTNNYCLVNLYDFPNYIF